jgi:hypothetical protein
MRLLSAVLSVPVLAFAELACGGSLSCAWARVYVFFQDRLTAQVAA